MRNFYTNIPVFKSIVLMAIFCCLSLTEANAQTPGSNQWTVYGYNRGSGDACNASGISFGTLDLTQWRGYYTATGLTHNSQGFWTAGASPSSASGWTSIGSPLQVTGTDNFPVNNDNHVTNAMRQGFPCGNYRIDINYHDDWADLTVDGVNVWEHCGAHNGADVGVWTGPLNSSSTVAMRHVEGGGDSYAGLSVVNIGFPNDVCSGATSVGIPSTTSGYTTCATDDAEPACGGVDGSGSGGDVWYQFTGNGSNIRAALCNSDFDNTIRVFSGSCGSLSCVAGNDDNGPACSGTRSSVDFCAINGTQYYIVVEGFGSAEGNFELAITDEGNTAPTFTSCGTGISVDANGCNATYSTPTATDDCGTPSVALISGPASGGFSSPGTHAITYRATDGNGQTTDCNFNVTITPPGNTATFGSNTWNVYAYDGADRWLGGTTYYGTYVHSGVSFNSATLWGTGGTPASAPGYVGCDPGTDYHTVVYKREGFPCGEYRLDLTAHDDAMVLYVNGNEEWQAGCCNTSGTGKTFCLDGSSTIEFRWEDTGGGSQGALTLVDVSTPPSISCPADINVNTNGSCQGTASWSTPGASDLCGITSVTQTGGPASGTTTFALGATTITYQATDGCGQTADCSFDVIVNDNIDPVITNCPGTVTVSADANCVATGVALGSPTATDNCAVTSTTNDAPGTFALGTSTFTWTVADAAGNTATCQQSVTVEDGTSPVISCPGNIVINNTPGNCGSIATWNDATFTDNCYGEAIAGFTYIGESNGHQFYRSNYSVNWNDAVADAQAQGGNLATIVDALENVFVANAISSSHWIGLTDELVEGSFGWLSGEPFGAFDAWNGGEPNNAASPNPPGEDYTEIQGGGGWNDVAGTGARPFIMEIATETAQTGGATSGSFFSVGTSGAITYEVTDASGNDATCSFTVTVNDNEDPTISCPADITVNNDAGVCGAEVTYSVTSTDNCPSESIAQDAGQASGTTFPIGTTPNTFTVTDASSNTATCSFNVTVNDNENPTITCPSDITVNNDVGVCGAEVTYSVTSTDNCPSESIAQSVGQASGTVFPIGTTPNTFTVTDASSNTASCSFNVTVNDNENPTITCPADITVNNDAGVCGADVSYNVTSTDNCPSESIAQSVGQASGTTFPIGTTPNTFIVTDASSNTATCSFNVTVNDNENPTITCPSDITVNNDVGVCGAEVTYSVTSTDNCPSESIAQDAGQASGTTFPIGTTPNTFTVTDASSNTATCSFNVTVNDNENPTITCPSDITVNNDVGVCGAEVTYSVISTDNCPSESIAQSVGQASGTTFPIGTTPNTFTVTDASSNTATCSFNVTVNDNENPTISCPADITVDNDAGVCGASVSYSVTSTDNCPSESIAQSVGQASGTTFPIGTTPNTFTVTDASSNTATCSFNVTVNDAENPVAICKPVTVYLNTGGSASIVPADVNNSSTDNCGITGLTVTPNTFDCDDLNLGGGGANTVTLEAEDAAGNTHTCDATVTVLDDIDPTVVCIDLTVQLDATGNVTVDAADGLTTATDNCGDPALFLSPNSFTCVSPTNNVGGNAVTYTVTDETGNVTTCNATITVEDNVLPDAVCQDVTVQLDGSGQATISSAASLDGGSTDACGIASLTFSAPTYVCADVFLSPTATLIVTDHNGNMNTCTSNVTVEDNVDPSIVNGCPANVTVNNDPGSCVALVSWSWDHSVETSDNCSASAVFTSVPAVNITDFSPVGIFGNFPVGTSTVTYTVNDPSNNVVTCDFTITVNDNEDPVITGCPSDITVGTQAPLCGVSGLTIAAPTASDNCTAVTLTNTGVDIFGQYSLGTTTITYTATDASSNQSICTYDITVVDDDDPTITCPADITVNNDADVCGASVSYSVTSSDNCPGESVAQDAGLASGATFPIGATVNTFTATDAASNTSSCSFTVTVNDAQNPTISCPADITVSNDGGVCGAAVSYSVTSTDNCPAESIAQDGGLASGSTFPVGATVNSFTVTDASSNTATCSFTVTVNDTEDPTISCPADITVSNDGGVCGAAVSYSVTSTDNCPAESIAQDGGQASGTTFPIGATVNSFTVTDASSNTATCSFTVTVNDTEDPTITCPADITVSNDGGVCGAAVSYSVTSTDNCPAESIAQDGGLASGSTFPVGATVNSFTVTDASSNTATCSFTVTVNDTEDPTISCPADITVSNDGGVCGAVVSYSVTSTDNCPAESIAQDAGQASGTTFPIGATTNTFTVTDASSNTATCSFNVLVLDSEDPVITCPADITVDNDADVCGAAVSFSVTSTDNCPGESVAQDGGLVSGSTFPIGATVNSFTATDASSNTATCSFTVTVNDAQDPVITCPADITVDNDAGICGAAVSYSLSSSDNCPGETITQDAGLASGSTFPQGVTVNSFTVTDASSNTESCSFTVTVNDTEDPVIDTDASDLTVECDGSGNNAELTAWLASNGGTGAATDNCSPVTWTHDFTSLSDDCGNTGSATVTFTATDIYNNSSTTTATFTIEDTTVPSIDAAASDLTVECDGSGNTAELNAWLASNGGTGAASDVCAGVTWTHDFTGLSDDCGNTGSATVTFTATDECGLSSSTTATFTIEDTTVPSIDTEASDLTVECDGSGNLADLNAWLASQGGTGAASDVCSGITWSNDFFSLSDDCGNTGSATVTFTATDECGLSSSTTATFTIEDTTVPSIDAAASDLTVECDGSGNTAELNAWLASQGGTGAASDVCAGITWSNDFTGLSDDCGNTGSATVTFTATDECGLSSSTTATFTIEDTTVPSIDAVASDLTVECDGSGNTAELNAWLASQGGTGAASDVCAGITWSNDFTGLSDDCGNTGSATVTFTATDECGLSSSTTATFTIEDTTVPSIDAAASDLTVECDGAGNVADLLAWLGSQGGTGAASDVCSGVTWSNDYTSLSDDCGLTGSATVTFTATDECGLSSSTTATFTIEDTTVPSIDVAASDLTVECDGAGNIAELFAWLGSNGGTGAASDVCAGVTWSNDFNMATSIVYGCGSTGSATVTFTATDECGLSSSTTATFTIEDTTVPSIDAAASDLTVECDGSGNTAELNAWLASQGGTGAASDICAGITWSNDFTGLSDDCGNTGSATVTFTATDECGLSSSTTATFTIEDTTVPSIDAAASDLTVECDGSGNTAELNAWLASQGGTGAASDICAGITWSNDFTGLSDDCGNTGSATVTFTATDECGLSSSTTATFTIEDTTVPSIDAAASDLTVECDGSGNTAELNAWLASQGGTGAASDICAGITWSNDFTGLSDDCGNTGSATVTFTATDECGLSSSTTATFTIEDTTVPSIDAAASDLTVECDGSGNTAELNAWLASQGGTGAASDICAGITWSNDFTGLSDDCGNTGSATVTFTATDECGLSSSTTATFTIEDTTVPSIDAAASDLTVECDGSGNTAELNAWLASQGGTGAASDICAGITWSNDFTGLSDDCGNTGSATVTFTATDECGLSSSTTATFTIEDTTVPSIDAAASDLTVECDGSGNTAELNAWLASQGGTGAASDICAGITWSNDFTGLSDDCGNTGSATVTFTATDECGLSSSTTATFTIEDTTVPSIDAAASDLTVECDGSGNTAELNAWLASQGGTGAASDICAGITWSNDFTGLSDDCGNTGSATVTFTATDECGLSSSTTATFTIEDTTVPSIDAAASDLTVECDGSGNTAELNAWLASQGGTGAASDICAGITWSNDFTGLSDDCGNTGSATVTFTATDECGLSSSTTATFTIEDTTVPSIDAAASDLTVECDGSGNTAELNAWLASQGGTGAASDICAGITWSNDFTGLSDDCGNTGSATVTFTATDECGLSSSTTATFTIEDTTVPSIDAAASDLTVECDGSGNTAELNAWLASQGGTGAASDICAGITWSNDFTGLSDDCGNTGSATVTFTATDECGLSSSTTATFTIEDTTVPSIDAAASDLTVECDGSGNTTELNAWLASQGGTGAASDICAGITWSNDFTGLSDDCGNTGSATVTFTATDECGLSSSTTATFTIEDTTVPSIDAAASDLTVECDGSGNTAELNAWLASQGGTGAASDICAGITWSNDFTGLSDDCGNTGSATVTFTATDECGLSSSTTATFTIEDTTVPSIDAAASDLTVECDGSGNTAELNAWLASQGGTGAASDICAGITWSNDFTGLSDDCGNTGSATVTFTATDECGLSSSTTATFTIEDTTVPSIDAAASDLTVECDGSGNTAELNAWLASQGGTGAASDICAGITWSNDFTGLSDDCGNTGSATVTFTATDECGLSSSTTATFTIEDTTVPSIDAAASDLTVECDGSGNTAELNAWLASQGGTGAASDICAGITWSNDFTGLSDDCGNTGSATVTFTATDECGLSSSTTATFTIEDTTVPSIDAAASDLTVECDGSGNTAELNAWLASQGGTGAASDICAGITWSNDFTGLSDDCGNTGSATVTFTATDECGLSSSTTATFTIEDTTVPSIDAAASDLTVECDGSGNTAELNAWLASQGGTGAASDICAGITWSNDFTGLSDDCGNTGSATVTFTATDECGLSSSTTATFTIEDTTVPSIDAAASDLTVECDGSGNTAELNAWLASQGGTGAASDICAGITWSNDFTGLSDDCGNTGSATVTFTATDECGLSSSTTATFTIEDTTVPSIDAAASDLTVECDGSGNTAELNAWLASQGGTGAASDICAGITWSNDFTGLSDDCGNTGSATVTFTATDECGLSSSTTATFTIEDTTVPSIDAAASDLTVECDGSGNTAELNAWLASQGGTGAASDICAGITWSNDFTGLSDDCGNTGSATVTFTATDECGLSSSTTATFTIEDTTVPSIDAAASDLTVECDGSGNTAELNAWLASQGGTGAASDICAGITWSNDFTGLSDDCGNTGSATVTFTATDECGLSSSTTATFTIEDTTVPSIDAAASDLTVECDGSGNTAELNAWLASQGGTGAASDICAGITWSNDFTGLSDDCGNTGSATVTFTATDECGLSSSTTATFTIEDTTVPSIDAAASDLTVECDGSGNTAELNAWLASQGGTGAASDICAGITWSNDFTGLSDDCGNTGSATVTFTATDECGLSSSTTATFTIEDTTVPSIDAAASDLTVECDGSGNTAELNAWLASQGGTGAASDICAGITWSNDFTGLSDDCGNTGSATVTFTATDECGLSSSTTATFTIEDTTVPSIDAAASDLTVECDGSGNTTELNAWLASQGGTGAASDICAGITWSNDFTGLSDDCGNTGSATVTFTATDECGLSSSTTATFTIEDTTDPTWTTAPADLTVECDGAGNVAELNAWLASFQGGDICASATQTNDFSGLSDLCGNTGAATVTFTLTDECGNDITADATFTIEDTTDPTWTTAPADLTVECDGAGNVAELNAWLASFQGGDICASATQTNDFSGLSDLCGNTGAATVTFTLTDECGNDITADATFTIEDTTDPTWTTAPADLTVECDGAGNVAELNAWLASFQGGDICASATQSNDFSGLSDLCGNTGAATVTFTLTDECGNDITADATFTIEDTTDPDPVCKDITIQLSAGTNNGDGAASIVPADINNGSSDVCGGVALTIDIASFDCSNVGANTITLTATDDCNNTASCTSVVTVEDNVAPDMVCQDINVTLDPTGNWMITAGDVDGGTNDNCGVASLSVSPSAFTCGEIGDNTVTLTAVDVNGNSNTCTANVNVYGEIPVVSIANSLLPNFCQGGTVELTANSNVGVQFYSWSTGDGSITTDPTLQTVEINSDGTYTVAVTSNYGCVTTETYVVTGFDSGGLLSAYTILAVDDVHLHDDNVVLSGGVGVKTNGDDKIKLHDNTHVVDFVQAPTLDIDNSSSAGAEILGSATAPLPQFKYNWHTDNGSQDVKVSKNSVVTLTGCVYDKIEIKENSTVTFTCDNIYIGELKTKDNVTIKFSGSTNIYAQKKIDLDKDNVFNPDGYQLITYTEYDFDVDEGSTYNGSVYSLKDIKVDGKDDNPTYMTGLYIAKKVHGHESVTWNWGTICSPPPPSNIPLVCDECKGGVVFMNLVYQGVVDSATVVITDKYGLDVYFSGIVYPGDTIGFYGSDLDNELDKYTRIYVDGVLNTTMHTSCSKPIGPGAVWGEFEVTYAESQDNGPICEEDPEDARVMTSTDIESKAYPNPFIDRAVIEFTLPEKGSTDVQIVSLTGEVILSENLGDLDADIKHTYNFTPDGNLSGGTYIYRIVSGKNVATGKLMFMK